MKIYYHQLYKCIELHHVNKLHHTEEQLHSQSVLTMKTKKSGGLTTGEPHPSLRVWLTKHHVHDHQFQKRIRDQEAGHEKYCTP